MKKGILSTYLAILAMIIGIEYAAGALVAPVIFNPAPILGDGILSHFQSGQLMSQIFLRFNIILIISTIVLIAFEIYSFWTPFKDKFSLVLTVFIVVLAALFVFYHTPFIMQAQALGANATQTEEFNFIHKQSEWTMKILMILQLILFFKRIYLSFKTKL